MSVAMEYQTRTPRFAERDDQQQQTLLDDARAGSRDAYGELLELHSPSMLGHFHRRLPSDLRAKFSESDLAQEACLNAIAGLDHFRDREIGRWRAWLMTICHNALARAARHYAANGMRDAHHEQSFDDLPADDGEEPYTGRWAPSPDESIIFAETLAELRRLLDRLPADDRQIFLWRESEGLTFVEIGDELTRSESSVRRAFGRALALLQRGLAPVC